MYFIGVSNKCGLPPDPSHVLVTSVQLSQGAYLSEHCPGRFRLEIGQSVTVTMKVCVRSY